MSNMKKQTSTLAIVVAVIFSIILFPFIFVGGIASGAVFSAESILQPGREDEFYRSFVDNGGIDWVYDWLGNDFEESMAGEEALVEFTELFPKDQVESMVYDIFHAIMNGEEYQADLSYQKDVMRLKMMQYFEETVEDEIRKNYSDNYDLLDAETKAELIETAKTTYEDELDIMLEEEFRALEEELSSLYDSSEFQDLMEIEELGYSLTDRTELCSVLKLAGYILLGVTGFLLVVLLLCHLFRPSGFITAGVFALIDGGFLMMIAKAQGVLLSLISSELSVEFAAEDFPEFIMPMIEDGLFWCLAGFAKVGKIGLVAGMILFLVGILLFVIRKNKAEAAASAMDM